AEPTQARGRPANSAVSVSPLAAWPRKSRRVSSGGDECSFRMGFFFMMTERDGAQAGRFFKEVRAENPAGQGKIQGRGIGAKAAGANRLQHPPGFLAGRLVHALAVEHTKVAHAAD